MPTIYKATLTETAVLSLLQATRATGGLSGISAAPWLRLAIPDKRAQRRRERPHRLELPAPGSSMAWGYDQACIAACTSSTLKKRSRPLTALPE